jgi:hypothetical protein
MSRAPIGCGSSFAARKKTLKLLQAYNWPGTFVNYKMELSAL